MTQKLASGGVEPWVRYHPDAPRPGFVWNVRLPSSWRVVDIHPARWQVVVKRLADDYVPGVRLSAAQKRLVEQQLGQLVEQAQKAGALLVLVLPGVVDGEVSAATVVLRWADSAPIPASVISAERQLAGSRSCVVENTGRGDSYVFASATSQVGPVTDRRTAYTYQGFLPVASTTWTLAVSGSAPSEDTGEIVADIVRRIISSVRVFPDTVGEQVFDVTDQGSDCDTGGPIDGDAGADVVDAGRAVRLNGEGVFSVDG